MQEGIRHGRRGAPEGARHPRAHLEGDPLALGLRGTYPGAGGPLRVEPRGGGAAPGARSGAMQAVRGAARRRVWDTACLAAQHGRPGPRGRQSNALVPPRSAVARIARSRLRACADPLASCSLSGGRSAHAGFRRSSGYPTVRDREPAGPCLRRPARRRLSFARGRRPAAAPAGPCPRALGHPRPGRALRGTGGPAPGRGRPPNARPRPAGPPGNTDNASAAAPRAWAAPSRAAGAGPAGSRCAGSPPAT